MSLINKYYLLLLIIIGCSTEPVEKVDHFKNIYGLSTDTLNVSKYEINSGQNLSDILDIHGIDYQIIDQIVLSSRNVYDVRKMRAGNSYYILSEQDSLADPKYLVYERNPIDFVVFSLQDSFYTYLDSKLLTADTVTTYGEIDGSLWFSMIDNNNDPELAINLSDVYAWTIDFFGLYSGDSYKIIYEKTYADTQYIGIGNILSAEFRHRGYPYFAYIFDQDGQQDYFDEKGESLRRAFLKAPLKYSRISSRFSYNRMHPILKIRRPHLGVDYVAPIGTPVQTVGDGVITRLGYAGQAGRLVEVKHNGNYKTQYMHLSKYGNGIKVGKRVMQGDIVGYVGSSGLSTAAHLDFRFYKNGQAVDPLKVKSPAVKPVKSENLEEFYRAVDYWNKKLGLIPLDFDNSTAEIDTI